MGGGARVLDVGAGTGNVAVAALRAGACVTASDLTPLMVERGLARTGPEVVWVEAEAEAEALPFEDGAFDCALSCFGRCSPRGPRLRRVSWRASCGRVAGSV